MYYQDVFEFRLQGSKKPVAMLLVAMAAIFLLFNISVWTGPTVISSPLGEGADYNYRTFSAARPELNKSSYNVIARDDIFTSSRAHHARAVAQVKPPSYPAVSGNAPKLKLLGTVLLYGDDGALMSQVGQGAEYYRTGDEIDGYKVVEIGRNFVMLSGAGGTLEVSLTQVKKRNSNKISYI